MNDGSGTLDRTQLVISSRGEQHFHNQAYTISAIAAFALQWWVMALHHCFLDTPTIVFTLVFARLPYHTRQKSSQHPTASLVDTWQHQRCLNKALFRLLKLGEKNWYCSISFVLGNYFLHHLLLGMVKSFTDTKKFLIVRWSINKCWALCFIHQCTHASDVWYPRLNQSSACLICSWPKNASCLLRTYTVWVIADTCVWIPTLVPTLTPNIQSKLRNQRAPNKR
jgi:hypothetical protein